VVGQAQITAKIYVKVEHSVIFQQMP